MSLGGAFKRMIRRVPKPAKPPPEKLVPISTPPSKPKKRVRITLNLLGAPWWHRLQEANRARRARRYG